LCGAGSLHVPNSGDPSFPAFAASGLFDLAWHRIPAQEHPIQARLTSSLVLADRFDFELPRRFL
jgi:hypothetical protein